ncbi:MAG TPA: hypothetical protein VFD62_04120 [Pyrinomonadaceae bacterium]|nr:hypothetical protein [Pyrinomonadaceae bacterium]
MGTRNKTRIFLLLSVLLFSSSVAMSQAVDQQDAINLLKTTARSLKSESDKIAAGKLQARIADTLWTFDEPFARETFRSAFESISQAVADDLPKEKQAGFIKRQATAVKEVLQRFGTHDSKQATEWLKAFENERAGKSSEKVNSLRPDVLMQIAAQLALTDSEQAMRLGLLALAGDRIPEGFGSLLFSLSRNRRDLSDDLFRAAVATLRRNNYVYDIAILILANYLFTPDGELQSTAKLTDAQLLADYYVDAAWKQSGGDGTPVSSSSASFYNQLELRALTIVSRYAPNRLPELRGQMTRIASGLNAEQRQRTDMLRGIQRDESTLASRNNYSVDEQVERAEKEKNPQVRDALFLSIANRLMREDEERALTIAKKIQDEKMRASTEDDIYLVKIQSQLRSLETIAEARKISSQFNNQVFRAKILVQLAASVLSRYKDQSQAIELLSEALTALTKADDIPDKMLAQLQVAELFAKFDTIRGFEVLGTALATMNRLQAAKEASPSATTKPPLLRIMNLTVVNGVEMTAGNNATIDAIDFREVQSLAAQDYMQARLLASKLEQPSQRANYLIAVAATVLKPEKRPASTTRN